MIDQLIHLWIRGWRSAFEIILLSVAIYYGYLYFRGTRGAKVLTGLAIVFLTLTLISTLLNLVVIGWIVEASRSSSQSPWSSFSSRSCGVASLRSVATRFSR